MADLDWLWVTKLSFLRRGCSRSLNESFSRPPVVWAPAWLYNGVHPTNNCGLQIEIIQPYCLKANQDENKEESTGNVMAVMIDEGQDDGWRGQWIWILPPPAKRQQLADEKWSCGVKEVRSVPAWQECGHYHATAMGIKLSYFCNVQLPAGDKHRLTEPVNLPASLGTRPHRVNWWMHLQHCCLLLT